MSAQTENQTPVDLSNIKLERGPTPHNINQICFDLCQQYLGGVWLNLNIDEINVKRLSGGLTNQMYYCAINEDKQIIDTKEPQEVSILLYGNKFFNNLSDETNKRLTDTIIAFLISESGLGPIIYGLFEGGQIQKYYRHRGFEIEEQRDQKLVIELAQKLAQIHAMDVPIKKTGNWIFDFFDHNYRLMNERFDLKALIDETKCETFKTHDIKEELEWLKKAILDFNCPQTFTHVDFRSSNVMITESDGIVLCDFEYSCYGHRGFDFGAFFCEWGQVWGKWNYSQEFPSDETLKPFIDSYIEKSVELKGKQFSNDCRNSFERIVKEVKLFSLVAIMWVVMFHLPDEESIIADIPFDKLKSIVTNIILYKI